MPNAKEILDNRLVSGEISHEEYDRLLARISNTDSHPMAKPSGASKSVTDVGPVFVWFLPLVGVLAYRWLSGDEKTDLVEVFGSFGWVFYAITMGGFFIGVVQAIRWIKAQATA